MLVTKPLYEKNKRIIFIRNGNPAMTRDEKFAKQKPKKGKV